MAKKKRRARPKSLGKRFSNDPMRTAKSEWRKLPLPGKLLVAAAALGALGGATVAADIETKVPVIGGILGKTATWGAESMDKLRAQ
jgi:hypothetical protein|tara:strand:- start:1476 stop:1733 length:258 start_codon:yes stop_codon:yes gene_type:complete